VVAAVGTAIVHRHYVTQRNRELAKSTPLNWLPFNQELIDEKLSSGQSVLVMYYSHWKDRPLWRLDTEPMRLALFDKNIEIFSGNGHNDFLGEQKIDQARSKIEPPDGESWFGAIYYPDGSVATFKWIPDANEFASSAVETIRSR
jgi:hypothetical protein